MKADMPFRQRSWETMQREHVATLKPFSKHTETTHLLAAGTSEDDVVIELEESAAKPSSVAAGARVHRTKKTQVTQ